MDSGRLKSIGLSVKLSDGLSRGISEEITKESLFGEGSSL
jgi:hypothetical protein